MFGFGPKRRALSFKAHLAKAKRLKRASELTTVHEAAAARGHSDLQRARIQRLYEISKLLTRFESTDVTIPAVLAVVARALPLQSAILVLETDTPGRPRSIAWKHGSAGESQLRHVRAHLRSAYRFLVRAGIILDSPPAEAPEDGRAREAAPHCMLLPLVVDHHPIFGAVHLAATDPFDELDLVFVNAVVNQMAIAIARQAHVEARQAVAEGARAEAVTQLTFAEVGRRDAEVRQAAAERAEEQIRRAFAFARNVTVSLGEGVIAVNLEERAALINPAAEELLGCFSVASLHAPVHTLLQIHDANGSPLAPDASPFKRAMEGGQLLRCDESLFSTRRRPMFPVAYTCAPLWQAGRVSGAVLSFRDITQTKRAEQEQRAFAELSALLASSLEPDETLRAVARFAVPLMADLCIVDEVRGDGSGRRAVVTFADAQKQRELEERVLSLAPHPGSGTPQARVLESGEPLLVRQIDDAAASPAHAEVMRDVGLGCMLCVPLVARGRTLGTISFIMAESNRLYSPGDLAFAVEIGQRAAFAVDNARLYEHARRATRARDDLLAVVAHDLKNPLGVILLSLAMLEQVETPDRRVRSIKRLAMIRRSAQRMERLIKDLLDAAGIDAGHLSIRLRRVGVAQLITEAVETLSAIAQAKSITLSADVADDLPSIAGDSGRLQQVLGNLIGNALKFTPEEGVVTVRARHSGAAVTFSVEDTGPGVPEAERAHLFERFWQAERTARFGSGLGLYIVKGIVEAHGGSVWVSSTQGAGSTFSFTVPTATPDRDLLLDSAPAHAQVPDEPPLSTVARSNRVEELVRDIASRKRELHSALESARVARELAERAASATSDFTSILSHELRSPLTALQLSIEHLQRSKESPTAPEQQPILRRMLASVARLSALTESVVLHGAIRSGSVTVQSKVFDASALMHDVIEELRWYTEEKGIVLQLVEPGSLPPLYSDPQLVRLILLNMIGNVIEFSEEGRIESSISAGGGRHRVEVRDCGPGIAAGDRLRIFESFERLRGAKRAQQGVPGLGLGLALVREVALALGGTLELSSETGRGSTFSVTLPSAPPISVEKPEWQALGAEAWLSR